MFKRFASCFALLLFFASARGQDQIAIPSKINSYLLQNTVTGIGKDESGFLWVCSQFGLLRYDGFIARSYTTNSTPSFLSNRFGYLLAVPYSKDFLTYNELQSFLISKGKIHPFPLKTGEIILANENTWMKVHKNKLPASFQNLNQTIGGSKAILFFPKDTLIQLESGMFFSLASQKNLPLKSNAYLFSLHGKSFALDNKGIYRVTIKENEFKYSLLYPLSGAKTYISSSKEQCWFSCKGKVYQWDDQRNLIVSKLDGNIYGQKPSGSIYLEKNKVYAGTGTAGIVESKFFQGNMLQQFDDGHKIDNFVYSYSWSPVLKQYVSVSPKGLSTFTSPQKSNILVGGKASPSFVYNDFENNLWFQNGSNKLTVYNPKKRKITRSLSWSERVQKVVQYSTDEFVITGYQNIIRWDRRTNRQDTLFKVGATNQILSSLLHKGSLYVGTLQGLYTSSNRGVQKSLNKKSIRSLLQINDSTLLIGTYSHGVFKKIGPQLIPLRLDDRSFLSATVAMSIDASGDIWVSTNRGVFVWKKNSFEKNTAPDYFLETKIELPAEELNGGQIPGIYLNNEVVLPSSSGLIKFQKNALLGNNTINELSIAEVLVDGKMIKWNIPVEIYPNHKSILFKFNIAYSDNPNQFAVEYRIKNLDTKWVKLPFNRQIEFNRLPAGNYDLELRYNSQAKGIKMLHFEIKRFWYLEPWVWFLAFIIGILAASGIYYGRILLYKRNQLLLNNTIREKTKELQESLASLAQSKKTLRKEYRQRNKLYSILMHDLTSPLQFLSTFSIAEFNKKKTEKDSLRIIANTSNELSGFIQEFLFWLKRQNDNYSLQNRLTDLNPLLQDSIHFYQAIAKLKGNKILFFSNQNTILLNTDVDILKVIIRNFLDNANKFTQNGVIKVSTNLNENLVRICIEDSGDGLPEHLMKLLEQPIAISTFDPSINANHKMGLQISREFVALLGGKITVESTLGSGTKFILHFIIDK